MQVVFKNTGMIEMADIKFNGLTVIAGENDTGKSTIGKLMFSIIKTFNRYEREGKSSLVKAIQDLIDGYSATYTRKTSNEEALTMGKSFFQEIKKQALAMIDADTGNVETRNAGPRLAGILDDFSKTVKQTFSIEMNLETIPSQISSLIERTQNIKAIFRKYLKSVFGDNSIGNIYSKDNDYSITGTGEDNRILFEIIETGESAGIKQEAPLPFNDVTFIESPALINSSKSILASKTIFDVDEDDKKKVDLLEKPYAPVYMKDLMLKLTEYPAENEPSPIIDAIREIIQGDFYYDHNERDFIYKCGNKTFKSLSIASGINYLGMILILLKNRFLNKKSLIILDEPETNMHPDWQVRFAEVLVRLIKEGTSILLTSHSPYFIEALQLYSDIHLPDKMTYSFYLSEKTCKSVNSSISDVSHDISPIFDLLAAPFDKLEDLQIRD